MVDLFENDLVPKGILVEIPLKVVAAAILFGERQPKGASVFALHQHHGLASRGLCGFCDLVVGVIGEQGKVAVLSPGAESAIAGQKHPVVGMAHDAHEERSHPVDGADFVVRLSVERDFPS